jgi:hypothetical protein
MTKQHFNFDEIFSFAWSKTKQHAWFIACTFMIYAVIMSAVRFVPLLEQVTGLLVALSMLSISLIIVRNESFSFADLFNKLKSPRLVINFFALTVIYAAAVMIFVLPFVATASITAGTMLAGGEITTKLLTVLLTTLAMLIPGIYIAVRFKMYPYVLLENEHMTIVDVVKHTYKLTCCAFWQLFLLLIALTILNIVGALAFVVGLALTIPVSIFAFAHAFRKLEGHAH